jgi:hypothetical protein
MILELQTPPRKISECLDSLRQRQFDQAEYRLEDVIRDSAGATAAKHGRGRPKVQSEMPHASKEFIAKLPPVLMIGRGSVRLNCSCTVPPTGTVALEIRISAAFAAVGVRVWFPEAQSAPAETTTAPNRRYMNESFVEIGVTGPVTQHEG